MISAVWMGVLFMVGLLILLILLAACIVMIKATFDEIRNK